MKNFTLKFGKYKGQNFLSTPSSYQTWLTSQEWFKMPSTEEKIPRISSSWNGYSRKGESQEWAVFEWEKRQAQKEDCRIGICSCCEGSTYFGI